MKKLISIFLAFAIFFSLSYVLSENFSETSLATLNNPTSLFVYDLNKDGKDEILVTSIDGKLHVFDKSGTEKWNYPTNEIPYSVIVEDIDGDNLAEIIIGTGKIDPQSFRYSSGKIIILNHFGKQKWSYTTTVSYTHLRAHETVLDLVCRLLLEKKNTKKTEKRKKYQ